MQISEQLKPCQNKKGQSFVVMLGFCMSFLNLHQLPAAKKDMQKLSITTNVWSFLFCQSFRTANYNLTKKKIRLICIASKYIYNAIKEKALLKVATFNNFPIIEKKLSKTLNLKRNYRKKVFYFTLNFLPWEFLLIKKLDFEKKPASIQLLKLI